MTVIDQAVPFPSRYASLEVRSDGLWADHNVETPLDHLSLGLEAFGVALDDPAETYHGLRGERTALGFDLEWETDGIAFRWPPGIDRYEIPCRVHGEILVGDERIEFDGTGPARPFVGRTGLVGPGLVLDGVPPRRRHPPARSDHLAVGGVRDRLRAAARAGAGPRHPVRARSPRWAPRGSPPAPSSTSTG